MSKITGHPIISLNYQGLVVGLAAALLFFGTTVRAQESSIQGFVRDESGAVVPGAEVTVTNLETGLAQAVITSQRGFYSVSLLKNGSYQVKASMPGFGPQETKTRLEVGQVQRHDFRLDVGVVTESVEVRGDASSRLQFKPTDVGQVIDERRIHELPLDGRNYLDLAKLSVGVVRSRQAGRGNLAGKEGAVKVGGLAFGHVNILLDGVDNSSRIGFGPLETQAQAVKPSLETISEFKVLTNNTSAEYGFRAGAKILVSTKSGTNHFHGTLYEFHRNELTSANNFMFNRSADPGNTGIKAPTFLRNQFGAAFGGPVIRNRTFFFASYEGTGIRNSPNRSLTRTVPSPTSREGDFSQEPGGTGKNPAIYDPLTLSGSGPDAVRQPFPGNSIPENRWDPSTAQLLALYPLPNIAGRENMVNNYLTIPGNSDDSEVWSVRVDHNFNPAHRIFGRYSYRNQDNIREPDFPFPAASGTVQKFKGQNVALNYSASGNARTHNEFRFGLTHFPVDLTDFHTEDLNEKFGIKGAANTLLDKDDPVNKGLVGLLFSGGALWPLGGTVGRNVSLQETYHVADNFLLERGRHSLKFGGEFRQGSVSRVLGGGVFGTLRFDGRYTAQFPNLGPSRGATGNGQADALLGLANAQNHGLPRGEHLVAPYWGLYVQDAWRITPRLTISLGLRWNLFDGPFFPNADEQPISRMNFVGNIFDEVSDVLNVEFQEWTFPSSDRDCACRRDLNNWAPRIGIAYRLTSKTVIRAGGGIYYGENDFLPWEAARFQAGGPRQVSQVVRGGFEEGLPVSEGFAPLPSAAPLDILVDPSNDFAEVFYVPEFLPTLYTGQWFLDVQRELPWDTLLTVGYYGNASSHLSWFRNQTAPLEPMEGVPFYDASKRRWPAPNDPSREGHLFALLLADNVLNANYHALTVKAEKRYSGGLTFLSSFTWSKNIDYGRATLNQNTESRAQFNGGSPPTSYFKDLWQNRGRSGLNRGLAYNLSLLYELPAGPGKRWLQAGPASWFLGGWQVGGILSLLSGPPLGHRVLPDTQNTGGPYRGDLVRDPNLPESERTVDRWFDTEAIVAGPAGTFGTAGRNLIDGPGWKSLDFLASKDFQTPWEGHRVQFRFEAFNFTNTPHFGPPYLNIETAIAGIIYEADDARVMQFALRYLF